MAGAKKISWGLFFTLILVGLLLHQLYWRWLVSSIRFFDADEFSYMHWAAQVAHGQRPYTDFFSYFTPGFMWAFTPILWIAGRSAAVFTLARTVSFVIFLSILGSLSYLFGITRGWKWALLPAVILAFLPMPYDKFLEIRPDNLATLLAIIGVVAEVRALRDKKKHWWFFSGLAYSASLFVLAKMLSVVVVGGAIAILSALFSKSRKSFKVLCGKDCQELRIFIFGLFGPWALFFFSTLITGHFSATWYSLTRLPFEVYQSAVNFSMEAHLFFFPNASFYSIPTAVGGLTMGLIVNHLIWILAIFVGTLRVVTPFREGDRGKAFVELLIGGAFFVSVLGYVKFYPAKHSQYLIPIAVFIAYYAADGLAVFFDRLLHIGGKESLAVMFVGIAYILITVTYDVNAPKLLLTNAAQLTDLARLIQTIPTTARVIDLEGRMLFWAEGYPVCCVSIDSTLAFVTRRPPEITLYLAQYPADYIWDGDSGRLRVLTPSDLAYVQSHFTPVVGWGSRLWKRNN